jgi:hypothetical protein
MVPGGRLARRWTGQGRGDRGATAATEASGHCPKPKASSCESLLEHDHALPLQAIAAIGAMPPMADASASHEYRDDYEKDIEHVRATTR